MAYQECEIDCAAQLIMKDKQIFGEDQAEGLRKLFTNKIGIVVAVKCTTERCTFSDNATWLAQRLKTQGHVCSVLSDASSQQISKLRLDGRIVLLQSKGEQSIAAHDITLVIVDGQNGDTVIKGSNLIQKLVISGQETAVLLTRASEEMSIKFRSALDKYATKNMSQNLRWIGSLPNAQMNNPAQRNALMLASEACAKRLGDYVESIRAS